MGMKRGDTLLKVISAILVAAVVIYMGVYIINYFNDPYQSATAYAYTITDSIASSGIIVRTETVVYADSEYISITVDEGEKVAAGQEIAVVYASEEDMGIAAEISETEAEIAALESFLESQTDDGEGEETIVEDIFEISRSVAQRDFSELGTLSVEITSLVISTDESEAEERLSQLSSYLSELETSAGSGIYTVSSSLSGIFSTEIDGFESLTPDDLSQIAVSGLEELMGGGYTVDDDAIGKLVTEIYWYYAAVVDTDEISTLEEGDELPLNFGKYYNSDVEMTVEYISGDEDGESVVVFSAKTDLSGTLALREVTAEIETDAYTGILVPKEAVHVEDGQCYVYTVTALMAERKDVEIVYEMDDYYLVSSDTLMDGNEVIVKANDLYDGKILD